jgi:methylated-DNA-[protein]-cysteine S-methyltransferase
MLLFAAARNIIPVWCNIFSASLLENEAQPRRKIMTSYSFHETSIGELLLAGREGKLTGLYFADQAHAPQPGRDWLRQDDAAIFTQTRRQLDEYIAGDRKNFELPIGLRGTPFQLQVWQEIARIPFGQTISYGELAARIGAPHAVRAVGTAAGRNPLCWIVPCHRVVGKDGRLTGYAGGISRKRLLLDFEAGRISRLRDVSVPSADLALA